MARLNTKRVTRQNSDPHSVFFIAATIYRDSQRPRSAQYVHQSCSIRYNQFLQSTGRHLFTEHIEDWNGDIIIPALARVIGVSPTNTLTYNGYLDLFPTGLCGDLRDHNPHLEDSLSLGLFFCHADQSQRLR